MMAILQELQRMGKTIIISSHILSELETLCNRCAIIERGKLIGLQADHDRRTVSARTTATRFFNIGYCVRHDLPISKKTSRRKVAPSHRL